MCISCGDDSCGSCNPVVVQRGPQGPAGPQGPTGPTGPTGPAPVIRTTSVTSVTIGTGAKTFTVASGCAFAAGQFISVVSNASMTNWMLGTVTSYSGTTLVLNITDTNGSGTIASWDISLSGARGQAGVSINWLGNLASAPVSPAFNDGYHDTTLHQSYVWNGSAWVVVAVDGTNGSNGTNGTNGLSIVWKGTLAAPPGAPQVNWAYRDSVLLMSRIWDGAAWQEMNEDGAAGAPGAPGVSTVTITNTVYVDAVNGNDGTGLVQRLDKPFKTLDAAGTAAAALAPTETNRVLIKALPGYYTGAGNFILLRNHIDWDLGSACVEFTGTHPVVYDNGTTVECAVYGDEAVIQRNSNDSTSWATVSLTGTSATNDKRIIINVKKITSAVDKALNVATSNPVTINAYIETTANARAVQIVHNLAYNDEITGYVHSSAAHGASREAVFLNSSSVNWKADILCDNNVALFASAQITSNCHIQTNHATDPGMQVSSAGSCYINNVTIITGGGPSIASSGGDQAGANKVYIQGTSASNYAVSAVAGTIPQVAGGTLVTNVAFK